MEAPEEDMADLAEPAERLRPLSLVVADEVKHASFQSSEKQAA